MKERDYCYILIMLLFHSVIISTIHTHFCFSSRLPLFLTTFVRSTNKEAAVAYNGTQAIDHLGDV